MTAVTPVNTLSTPWVHPRRWHRRTDLRSEGDGKEQRRPAELVLAAAVARRHYLDGQSKVELADALGISRFKVARLLEFAREAGLVRIEIVADGEIDLDRSVRLQEAFGLRHAIVLDGAGLDFPTLSDHLGNATAQLLSEILTEDDVLGLPWARSIDIMTRSLRNLPRIDVVQLTGAMQVPGIESSAVDIVRRAARVTGGRASVFYAPLVLDDAAVARTLRRDSQVASVLARGLPRDDRCRRRRLVVRRSLHSLRRRVSGGPGRVPRGRVHRRDRRPPLRRRGPFHQPPTRRARRHDRARRPEGDP